MAVSHVLMTPGSTGSGGRGGNQVSPEGTGSIPAAMPSVRIWCRQSSACGILRFGSAAVMTFLTLQDCGCDLQRAADALLGPLSRTFSRTETSSTAAAAEVPAPTSALSDRDADSAPDPPSDPAPSGSAVPPSATDAAFYEQLGLLEGMFPDIPQASLAEAFQVLKCAPQFGPNGQSRVKLVCRSLMGGLCMGIQSETKVHPVLGCPPFEVVCRPLHMVCSLCLVWSAVGIHVTRPAHKPPMPLDLRPTLAAPPLLQYKAETPPYEIPSHQVPTQMQKTFKFTSREPVCNTATKLCEKLWR